MWKFLGVIEDLKKNWGCFKNFCINDSRDVELWLEKDKLSSFDKRDGEDKPFSSLCPIKMRGGKVNNRRRRYWEDHLMGETDSDNWIKKKKNHKMKSKIFKFLDKRKWLIFQTKKKKQNFFIN